MTNHLITPPPKLVQQWYRDAEHQLAPYYVFVARCAAQWSADQELEACIEWLDHYVPRYAEWSANFRAARRPKPTSLKEQALTAMLHLQKATETSMDTIEAVHIICRALEALPND